MKKIIDKKGLGNILNKQRLNFKFLTAQVATEYVVIYILALAGIGVALSIVSNFFSYTPPLSLSGFYNFNIKYYNFNGTTLSIIFSSNGFNFQIINFSSAGLKNYTCTFNYVNASGTDLCILKFNQYTSYANILFYYRPTNSSLGIVFTQGEVSV
ncbi:MAG: hypothetical protein QXX36_00960 [Candidatus Rehaiarchaeum fermentans]|nr:hypothetical protein [Candidatus Rehaiarchaeum fermentans]MCW1302184.1 hypothetical protein [Candidatus Rehaiarchaeum fermentans]